MIQYSVGVQLAWEISSYEALNKKASLIENDHIMLGILSLDKISENLNKLTESELNSFLYEKKKLYSTLINNGINITVFRRQLRNILPLGSELPADNVFHRSQECKQMFAASTQFAMNYITIYHLFTSIISVEDSYSRNLLIANKIDVEKLKTDLLFSIYKLN